MKWQLIRGASLNWLAGLAVALAGLVAPAVGRADEVIVESRSGGLNYARYSDSGSWIDSGLKSTATGCTQNIGSRSTSSTASPYFTVSPILATMGGVYEVYVTLPTSSVPTNLVIEVVQTGCTGLPAETSLFNKTSPALNNWAKLGTLTLNPSETTPSIMFRYKSGSLTTLSRFYADAVRFVPFCTVSISSPPASLTVPVGADATFNVTATGSGTLHYAWTVNGNAPPEATDSPTLTLQNVQLAQSGAAVAVTVTDSNCSVQRNTAVLTVTPPALVITKQPQSANVAEGNKAVFTVAATGLAPLSYDWYVDGVLQQVPSDPTTLTIENVQLTPAPPVIQVRVWDALQNWVNSTPATLTVVSCHVPFADANGDGDVDQEDFGEFQACYTGDGAGETGLIGGAYCACFDREPVGGDGDVDQADWSVFEQYATGPGIQWAAP